MKNLLRLRVLDRPILYDRSSGAWAPVDGKTWALAGLARAEKGGDPGTLMSRLKDLGLLKGNGQRRSKEQLKNDSGLDCDSSALKNIILQVSHACNLRCSYCGVDYGRYGKTFRYMSLATARKAVDFLFKMTKSSRLAITYFGGEPLLNTKVVLDSAHYALQRAQALKKSLLLHLVTNGVLLTNDMLIQLDKLGFSLTISLDGPPARHNGLRRLPDGKGSYHQTATAIERAASLPIGNRITLRGTYARPTVSFSSAVKFLVEKGFSKNISYEPVFLPRSHSLSLRWQDLPRVKKAYTDLARFYVQNIRKDRPFCFWDFDDALIQLSLGRPRKAHCGAGVTTVAITAEGDLYGCHMSTGMKEAWLGTLQDGILKARQSPWLQIYENGRPGCKGCWLKMHCGGGCNTHALLYEGSIKRPYRYECEINQWLYRMAMGILSECPGLKDLISNYFPPGEQRDLGHVTVPLWWLMENPTARGSYNAS